MPAGVESGLPVLDLVCIYHVMRRLRFHEQVGKLIPSIYLVRNIASRFFQTPIASIVPELYGKIPDIS